MIQDGCAEYCSPLQLEASDHLIARPEAEMLDHDDSYHHNLTGKEAGDILKAYRPHCHLTRFSKSIKSYMLSVFEDRHKTHQIRHYPILINEEGKLNIKGKEKKFDSIRELLGYYQENDLDSEMTFIGPTCKYRPKGNCAIL